MTASKRKFICVASELPCEEGTFTVLVTDCLEHAAKELPNDKDEDHRFNNIVDLIVSTEECVQGLKGRHVCSGHRDLLTRVRSARMQHEFWEIEIL